MKFMLTVSSVLYIHFFLLLLITSRFLRFLAQRVKAVVYSRFICLGAGFLRKLIWMNFHLICCRSLTHHACVCQFQGVVAINPIIPMW